MIRWIFYFDEGSIHSDVTTQEEELEIMDALTCQGLICIPGTPIVYVNLDMVKAVIRQELEDEPKMTNEPEIFMPPPILCC